MDGFVGLRSPYETDQWTSQDLGEGLSTAEYYWWTDVKREENLAHRARGHRNFCRVCKNCQCRDPQKRFRCICDQGKTYATPYRIRFRTNRQRDWCMKRVWCINDSQWESRDLKHG